MKYDPKEELLVLMAIEQLGEASIEEVTEYIANHWQELTNTKPKTITSETLLRYARRWNKRKAISSNIVNGHLVYSLADIPWFPKNQIIRCLKAPNVTEAQVLIDAYETKMKEKRSIREPASVYRDYKRFELIFETIDQVAGGIPDGERKLSFPKKNGTPFIPINWFRGWLRDNSGLMNLPQSTFIYKVGYSTGEFLNPPKLHTKQVKVKMGLSEYEYIEAGEKFKTIIAFPMHGTTMKTAEQLRQFFSLLEESPIKGLGAYPGAFGGRVKLVEMKELKPQEAN